MTAFPFSGSYPSIKNYFGKMEQAADTNAETLDRFKKLF